MLRQKGSRVYKGEKQSFNVFRKATLKRWYKSRLRVSQNWPGDNREKVFLKHVMTRGQEAALIFKEQTEAREGPVREVRSELGHKESRH